jgi:hypothetical protein
MNDFEGERVLEQLEGIHELLAFLVEALDIESCLCSVEEHGCCCSEEE